jgi:hypothetical protein
MPVCLTAGDDLVFPDPSWVVQWRPQHKAAKPRLTGLRRLTARSILVPTVALGATSVIGVSVDLGGRDDRQAPVTLAGPVDEPTAVPEPPRAQDRELPASRSAARAPLRAERSSRRPTAGLSLATGLAAGSRAEPSAGPSVSSRHLSR